MARPAIRCAVWARCPQDSGLLGEVKAIVKPRPPPQGHMHTYMCYYYYYYYYYYYTTGARMHTPPCSHRVTCIQLCSGI